LPGRKIREKKPRWMRKICLIMEFLGTIDSQKRQADQNWDRRWLFPMSEMPVLSTSKAQCALMLEMEVRYRTRSAYIGHRHPSGLRVIFRQIRSIN
jgi:hypothetical protein